MDPKRMDELMKELRRVVEAKPTRVVSTSVPGGSGYTALDNESIEEVDFWGDYDDLDDEQFFQAVERVEKQRAKEEAAAAARLGKTAKLRVRDANVSGAARGLKRGPEAKRARVGGAGSAGETEVVGIVPMPAEDDGGIFDDDANVRRKRKTRGGSRLCMFPGCSVRASFALPGQSARHCKAHCEEGEENVVSKMCQSCNDEIGVATFANPRFSVTEADGTVQYLCARCFRRKYPQGAFKGDERANGRIDSREGICVNAVMNAVALKDLPWTHDRPFWFGCWEGCDSKRRVDTWTLIGGCVLGVEIDENQHKGNHYAADAEIRTNEIAMEIGAAPLYLVRLNPDPYVAKSGCKIKGFFEVKQGKAMRRQSEIDRRLKKLIKTLKEKRSELEKRNQEKSTVIESYLVETFLFFDGYEDNE